MKYKRWIVFGYEPRDACGGLNDIYKSYDDLQEAKDACYEKVQTIWGCPYTKNDIVDRDTWEVVWSIKHE